jgi:hypothetical protein
MGNEDDVTHDMTEAAFRRHQHGSPEVAPRDLAKVHPEASDAPATAAFSKGLAGPRVSVEMAAVRAGPTSP